MSMRQHNDQKDQFFYDKNQNLVGRVADKQSIEMSGDGIAWLVLLASIPAPCILWKIFMQGIPFEKALDALRSPGCWAVDVVFWAIPMGLFLWWTRK